MRKGETALAAVINAWIAARSQDGWLKARHDYWFTTLEWEASLQ